MNENRNELSNGSERTERQGTSRRGFASMDRERQREIARKGGRAAHEQGVAHQWSSEEARAAGRKGGQSSRGSRTASPSPQEPII
jgi:general stress protein YciG